MTISNCCCCSCSIIFISPLPEKIHRQMTCEDTSIEKAKQDLKIEAQQSPPAKRRVIFPSLHPERFQKAKEQREEADITTPSSPDSVSSVTIEDERRSMVPLSLFPIRSPGLHVSKHSTRIIDELDLEVSRMSLTDTSVVPPPCLMPKPRLLPRVSPKPVCPAPTDPVARCLSLDRAPLVRRNRIDRNHYTARPDSYLSLEKKPCKLLPSILKPSKFSSSVPSLVPVDTESNSSSETLLSLNSHTKSTISFDPRVRVVEYVRSQEELERTWFSQEELDHFRKQTIARLVAHNTELLPSGTGFVVQRTIQSKAVFAYPIMGSALEEDDEGHVECAVNREIRNVLVVDPHHICLKLFAKDLKGMIPEVNVCAARSSEEALKLIEGNYQFDIIIVEERLNLFHRHKTGAVNDLSSGSAFIKSLSKENGGKCLFIAVSAHLDKDKQIMEESGSDFIWAKPPPQMDEIMRDVLLKALLVKRGKHSEADKLFGGILKSP
jgi:CheY-like chemotaxis protein